MLEKWSLIVAICSMLIGGGGLVAIIAVIFKSGKWIGSAEETQPQRASDQGCACFDYTVNASDVFSVCKNCACLHYQNLHFSGITAH